MSELVEDLRAVAATHTQHFGIMREAAARIEELEAILRVIITKCERGIWSDIDAACEIARTALRSRTQDNELD